jgi:TRAP transporter TAXI family solute receptor
MVLAACLGCSSAPHLTPGIQEPARGSVVISAGNVTGVYYAWSEQLARQLKITNPKLRVVVERSGGSVSNLQRLLDGTADLALTTVDATERPVSADVTPGAANPQGTIAAHIGQLRALGRIYDDYVQIVVRADSGLHKVADLAGRRVAIGEPGSGVTLITRRVLGAARITVVERDLGLADGMAALERRQVDAVFWSGGIPTPSIATTALHTKLRLLPLGDLAGTLRATYGSVYRPATIPPGRYQATVEVGTVASANLLVTRADANAAMVTAVLSTIFDRRDALGAAVPAANATDRRSAIWTGPLSLHPAAVAYYRRTKP